MDLIALVDKNWALGYKGEQIIYIPDDLKHFKLLTKNKTVVLGRKTLYTFPNKKPLKERRNLILSKDENLKIEGAEVFYNIDELLKKAPDDAFVIGGESVYKELFKYCERAYITMVDHSFEADKFLPDISRDEKWKLSQKSEDFYYEGLKYNFLIYKRKV